MMMKPFMRKYPPVLVVFSVVGLLVPSFAQQSNSNPVGKYDSERGCVIIDDLCLLPEEVPNYEAIKTLHSQLDDDRSGDIDVTESVEFLREELQYAKGYEKRQRAFHENNDQYISVRELWSIWKKSEVHSWTVEQTVAWLAETVELKQYATKFYENAVNGSVLPRLAANNEQFLTKVLGIRDPKHRSKITIKAMDVVLFGPPKDSASHVKDLVLVTLLTLALIGCFKAYQRNREYEKQLGDMLSDMEKLREAEENLQQLELRMNSDVRSTEEDLPIDNKSHDEELQALKLELEQEREKNEQMKEQMKRGLEEAELDDHHWCAPMELQYWLQLTYERERIAFEKKQIAAREQFAQAREMCEKLNHQRRSLMGVLASVHGKMDNVDQSISRARTILEEVTTELSEKNQRWKNIEILAGCNIISNAGIHTLELMLRPQLNGRPHSTYAPSIVQQLLSNQSALMFLTMGGSSYFGAGSGSLNSSAFVGTPRDSMVDVRSTTGSLRKRSQLIARDSGSSLGSESSVSQTNFMHHSHTFSTGLSPQSEMEESIRRVSSTGSLNRLSRRDRERSKDSNDSSTEETDGFAFITETTSFSMGGSQLTLNSESSSVVSPSQEISASEPALDSPKTTASSSIRSRKLGPVPSEEGNSSDSSVLEERPPSADSRKKSSKNWFRNGFTGSLKIGKSKKQKDIILKDSNKDSPKI